MTTTSEERLFGPVPSRRLGQSCGINLIPAKTCSYSCVYCQVGKTTHLQIERKAFHSPQELITAVEQKIKKTRQDGIPIDYWTFVANGEPTLDSNLGLELEAESGMILGALRGPWFVVRETLKLKILQKVDTVIKEFRLAFFNF